ncbi:cyanophycinase [Panacibacter sp. DH6]|uniref:Cyanophycinase n=1 Tax=Panacibacter microcysteis TaxID=2793269 RepID=A0A931GYK9_9BACT|nr:cyanophycinase [Panacibacter microcysteis]MBG9376542.1 cyanophycinase [Panacibacter microcysteis]
MKWYFVVLITFTGFFSKAQKGSLFIIGGGDRTPAVMQAMMQTAALGKADHIAILPMSGAEPDTSFYYISQDLKPLCSNTIAMLNFTRDKVNDRQWLDSLKTAKLIFITGGDQSHFMKAVLHTPVFDAIHEAYKNGATIAGTSAGAAVMSKHMVTGNQLRGDTVYHSTFDRIWNKNIQFEPGLGLLDSVIIDQHFVVRSRYNRMMSALEAYPSYTCIGIDESTAIIVHAGKITVAGDSQVIVMKQPTNIRANKDGLIQFDDVLMSIYTAGEYFKIQ